MPCEHKHGVIKSCEQCDLEGAEWPFDVLLDRITGSDPNVTDYILETPALCPAQRVEIYPNAGFIWPRHMANGQNFRDQAIWGAKGGVFLGPNTEVGGSFEYLNHFQLREPPNPFDPVFGVIQPAVRGFLYDANFAYNFGERPLHIF